MVMDRGPHLFATDHYENITSQLKAKAKALGPGGFIQARNSRMYDTLQASQIGVTKLDTGPPHEFKLISEEIEGVQKKFPLDSDVNAAKFMDCLKSAELAWHHGYSLLQTVLSNLALENELNVITEKLVSNYSMDLRLPELASVADLVQVYIWSIIKCLGQCMTMIEREASSAVKMEEDLHYLKHDMYWLEELNSQYLVEMLEKCRKQATAWNLPLVAHRLDLQSTWMTVLNQRIPKRNVNLDKMLELLRDFELLEKMEDARCWFTTGVQARLNMASLRHPLNFFSQKQSKDLWVRIVNAIKEITPVLTVQRSTDLMGLLLSFSRREEPPIVRAMVNSKIDQNQVLSKSAKQWTIQDLCETMPLPTLVESSKNILDPFLKEASQTFVNLLSSFCENRCRLRETLGSLVLSYDSLQFMAESIDQQLSANFPVNASAMFISSYVYFRKLQVMLWIVLLSFETDIIAYDEQAFTYWYAFRLCQTLLAHLGRMRLAFETAGGDARSAPGYHFLAALEIESQMLQQICLAELLVWQALHLMLPPKLPPVNIEYRFRLRFKIFQSVGVPETLQLAAFKEFAKDWEIGLALQGAANAAKSARGLLTRLGEFAQGNSELSLLQRSAVGLQVAVAKLVKLDQPPSKVNVSTQDYHPYFPIPNFT